MSPILGQRFPHRRLLSVTRLHRAYEGLLGGLPSGLRSGPGRLAERLGLFEAYLGRIQQWRSGARPQTSPDPRFKLSAVAGHWRALLADQGTR